MTNSNLDRTKWRPIALVATLVVVVYMALEHLPDIAAAVTRFLDAISPLLIGILLTYFLYIPFTKLKESAEKSSLSIIRKHPKAISLVLVLCGLILVIVFLVAVIAPIVVSSLTDLISSLPAYGQSIMTYLERLENNSLWTSLDITSGINNFLDNAISSIFNASVMEQITRFLIDFAGGAFDILISVFISFYILVELESIGRFFRRLSNAVFKNAKVRDRVNSYFSQGNKALLTFLASKSLDCVINFAAVTVILLIARVPYALLFGLISGIFNFIPYLGSLTAVLLISLVTLVTDGPMRAIPVLIALTAFQQTDANYIDPRIMKHSLKLSPILVIISVIAFGAYFGVIGMFLAVPTMAVFKQILFQYIENAEASQAANAEASAKANTDASHVPIEAAVPSEDDNEKSDGSSAEGNK